MSSLYRYEAANLFTDATFAILPLPACEFDLRLCQPGSFSLPSPLGVANARIGRRLAQIVAGACSLYVYRRSVLWWGGIVWTSTAAGDQDGNATRTLQGATFDSYVRRVNFQNDLTLPAGDPLEQVRALLSDMQADPYADISLIADTTTSGLSVPAITHLASSNSSYGQAVDDLASQDPGFEYTATTTVSPATGERTRRLRLGYPQLGNPGTVHRFTRGRRSSNILTYSLPADATTGGTEARAFGATANTNLAGVTQPAVSGLYVASAKLAAGWPRLDFGNSYPQVSDTATLNAHAQADLAAGQSPVTIPQITVRLDQTDLTPDSLGDTAVIDITDANFPDRYRQTCRIVGIQVNTADRSGQEYATLILN
jgi:hypothetical protein